MDLLGFNASPSLDLIQQTKFNRARGTNGLFCAEVL
jgi:hypothetical protein